MKVILRAVSGDEEIMFEVGTMKVTVGRHSSNIVRLKDNMCSSNHCVFWVDGRKLFIEDQESKNGCFINGVKIFKNQVFIQDKITIGNSTITVASRHNTPEVMKELDFPGTADERTSIGIVLQTNANLDLIRLNPRSSLENDKRVFGKRITHKIIRPRGYQAPVEANLWHDSWRHWMTAVIDSICLLTVFITPFLCILYLDDTLDEYTDIVDLITSTNLMFGSMGSVLLCILFRHWNLHNSSGSIGEQLTGLASVPKEMRVRRY